MATTNKQRIDLMENFLREHRYADLNTLALAFDASLSTVRRALNELEARGLIRRHHGGASWIAGEEQGGYDFITQDNRQSDAKHAMAQYVNEQVQPGMTVMLDGGTSTYAVARLLVGKRIIVITNSLPIAALYNEVSTAETILTGGTIYHRLGVLYGPSCEAHLAEMHADLSILGAAGCTKEGLWNSNPMIVAYQKKMIRAADRTIFVVDHTKLGRRSLVLSTAFFAGLTLVTTATPEESIRTAAESARTQLVTLPVRRTSES